MNISKQIKTVSLIWLFAGIALIIWSAIELFKIGNNPYLGTNSGAFKSTLIGLTFGVICVLGSKGLMKKTNWGRILILVSASIVFLYGVSYLLMGGFEDTGIIYAVVVSALFLFSIFTVAVLARKKKYKEWAT